MALPWGRLPEGLEVSCRSNAGLRVYVVCNHGPQPQSLALPGSGRCILTGAAVSGAVTIPANDVVVVGVE